MEIVCEFSISMILMTMNEHLQTVVYCIQSLDARSVEVSSVLLLQLWRHSYNAKYSIWTVSSGFV